MKLDQSLFNSLQQMKAGQYIPKIIEDSGWPRWIPRQVSESGSTMAVHTSNAANSKDHSTTTKPRTHVDFTQMSRSQLNDWLSKAKTADKISADQATAFKVLAYSAKTGSSDSTETQDSEQLNFTEKAKQGLQSAIKRRDRSAIDFWANSLAVMKNFQGEKLASTEPKP